MKVRHFIQAVREIVGGRELLWCRMHPVCYVKLVLRCAVDGDLVPLCQLRSDLRMCLLRTI